MTATDLRANHDVLVVARRRGFWETEICERTFPHLFLLPAYVSNWSYPWHFAQLLFLIARIRPHAVILGTTMPLAHWVATLRRFGFFQKIHFLTDNQFLSPKDIQEFAAVWIYSNQEKALYPESVRPRLYFLPYPSKAAIVPITESNKEEYLLSSGNHKRDHDSVLKALLGMNVRAVVVTENEMKGPVPENAKILKRLPMDEYFSLMAHARFVVVPLKKSDIPHGHSDLSAALSLGKAVITTRGASAGDYVTDGVEGLLVEPEDVEGYRAAIEKLWSDDVLRKKLEAGVRAKAPFLTYEHFARELMKLLALQPGSQETTRTSL